MLASIIVMAITAGRKAACHMRLILQTRRKPMSKLEAAASTDALINTETKADDELTEQALNKVSGGDGHEKWIELSSFQFQVGCSL
jgi:hypothetical protein